MRYFSNQGEGFSDQAGVCEQGREEYANQGRGFNHLLTMGFINQGRGGGATQTGFHNRTQHKHKHRQANVLTSYLLVSNENKCMKPSKGFLHRWERRQLPCSHEELNF